MILSLFHPKSRRVFHGARSTKSPYWHTFGGTADYAGLVANKRQPPVHLLFRLNLADPSVGITLPNVHWLPLLCAIRYGACNLAYRVISDAKVKILFQSDKKAWAGFPYDGYPEKLETSPIVIKEGSYNPKRLKDALAYAGVFGYGALSAKQYARLRRHVERKGLPDLLGWTSTDAYLEHGVGLPFVQGRPGDDCPNRSCVNHGRESSLTPFAIFEEEPARERTLWGPNCESLQIIYQICPECGIIRTGNQCT